MNIDFINGYLEAIADLGHGINHGNNFYCVEIAYKENLHNSLEKYFSENLFTYNTREKKQRLSAWTIQITNDLSEEILKKKLISYFFEQECSPKLKGAPDGMHASECVDSFLKHLERLETESKKPYRIHHVFAESSEVFYDAVYDDFIIDYGKTYLLIHLGWSD